MQEGNRIAKECAITTGITEDEGYKIRNDPKSNLNDEKAQVMQIFPAFRYFSLGYLKVNTNLSL